MNATLAAIVACLSAAWTRVVAARAAPSLRRAARDLEPALNQMEHAGREAEAQELRRLSDQLVAAPPLHP